MILITGAGGFLGTTLTRVFVEAGHRVRAADLVPPSTQGAAEAVELDVTRPETVRTAMEGVVVVVHAAGIFDLSCSEQALRAVNVEGAATVARCAAEEGVERFVMVSSTSVYGRGTAQVPEGGDKRPAHAYDRSKWEGEEATREICETAGLSWAAIRPTLIYGPGGRYGFAPALAMFALRSHLGRQALPFAAGGPVGHHVHVEDVACAALFLVENPAGTGAFNVADDNPIQTGELMRLICGAVGVRVLDWGLPWFVASLFGLIKPMARWYLDRLNPKLVGVWGKIVRELDLVPALSPRLDVDWIDYIIQDHSYDNSRLKALGFRYRYPDLGAAFGPTVDWYRQMRWLPPGSAPQAADQ
ncbi:MAG TPA: NAD(P)-dependent oxidoreductase [Myxococcota bacterium]|nr:NAD(P)-dependent oxidoreductase [Myxococcota bacterium]